jgi:hypothetical protein
MRDPVTTTTRCSAYVNDGAIRLFTLGYLAQLRYDSEEDGTLFYQIPSETQDGVVYTISYTSREDRLHCSCPAGQHNVPCKHVRLFQLRNGWAVEARG